MTNDSRPTVFDQERVSLFTTSLTDQPSRRIRDEEYEDHHEDGSEALEDQWELPCEVALDIVRAKGDRRSRDGPAKVSCSQVFTDKPRALLDNDHTRRTTIVNPRHLSSHLRRRYLDTVCGGGYGTDLHSRT